jgi:hypothetical protein
VLACADESAVDAEVATGAIHLLVTIGASEVY